MKVKQRMMPGYLHACDVGNRHEIRCAFFAPEPHIKRSGLCVLHNVCGPLGCERDRGSWCCVENPQPVCACPRCSDQQGCALHTPALGFVAGDPAANCWSCRYRNTYGKYGCSTCLD